MRARLSRFALEKRKFPPSPSKFSRRFQPRRIGFYDSTVMKEITSKMCMGCGVEKPITEFYTKIYPNGRRYPRSRCKMCTLKYGKNYGKIRKFPKRTPPELQLCKKCNTVKCSSEFYPNKWLLSGLSPRCKECDSKHATQWRLSNPDKIQEINRKRFRTYRESYADPYIRSLIRQTNTGLKGKPIPTSLVLAYKAVLQLKRHLKAL